MDYRIEIYDTWNRLIETITETPLLAVYRGFVTEKATIRGLLPSATTELGHNYHIKVYLEESLVADARVEVVRVQVGDTKKLILETYVPFKRIVEVQAVRDYDETNHLLEKAYTNKTITEIFKDAICSVPGRIHYAVDHGSYPDGAVRECSKFTARLPALSEFPIGLVSSGEYVSGSRIDASGATAPDGDTISGLKVDGVEWPDVRLMMLDTEEMSVNSHTLKIHPEVATWSETRYNNSGYKFKAQAAHAALQNLIDTKGISHIELNWHRDTSGNFDDRVDAYGRYVGLVYGGGECFNAAMVELGHSKVYLYEDGKYHVPEMKLKEYFSYEKPSSDSIEECSTVLTSYDAINGIYEVLTFLAYAAGGYVWHVDGEDAIHFRQAVHPDRVIFYDPLVHEISLRSNSSELANRLYLRGTPLGNQFSKSYSKQESIDEYGLCDRGLELFSLSQENDADLLAEGLLKDVAYPQPDGFVRYLRGDNGCDVGDLVEVRGDWQWRVTRELPGEWGGLFTGKNVFRVSGKRVFLRGRRVETFYYLTSPLRSVSSPVSYLVRSQPSAESFFQFRLDASSVGLDLGFHLD